MMYGLLLCAFYFISNGEGFLLESSTTGSAGTHYLTYRHYMQLMELLFDEKQARHQLEQTVMKLQNKLNLVNNNNGVQENVNISEYIQPYIFRLEDQEKELINLRQSYAANLKSQGNELNTLRHIVTDLQQNYTMLKQTTSNVQLDNGRLKQEVETLKLIKNIGVRNSLLATNNELQKLKVKSEARSQDFMGLYNMATSQAQDIRQLSKTLENTYNDSTVDEIFMKVEKKISGLEIFQHSASVLLKDVVHNITEKDSTVDEMFIKVEKKISDIEHLQNSASVSLKDVVHNITIKGFTACGAVRLYGDFVKFTEIRTVYGITIANAYRDGQFRVTKGGFYLVVANILGSGSTFYIVVNNRAISRAWYDYNAKSGDGFHTAATSAFLRLSPGDTVSIKSTSVDAGSCMTIVKL